MKTERDRMSDIDSAAAGSYEPAAIYYGDSDCLEYVREDNFCIYERVDEYLTLIKDAESNDLVGFKLKGFKNRIHKLKPQLELNDRQFLYVMSAIENICSELGDLLFADVNRSNAYKAAYKLADNDNVKLDRRELDVRELLAA